MLYHGTISPNLTVLEPRSLLHGSGQRVAYLTREIPYAALYIWDTQKNGGKKHITAWVKDGVTHYEEQFPQQLQTFYEGVRGWICCLREDPAVEVLEGRQGICYSTHPMPVERILPVDDVWQLLLQQEAQGKFCLHRFQDATPQRQQELTQRIADWILQQDLLHRQGEETDFYKAYFSRSWELARSTLEKQEAFV